jgi:hypothetical protein
MKRLAVLVSTVIAVTALASNVPVAELRGDRVTITSPGELEWVTLPLTVKWEVDDLPGDVRRYAVFVDRLPMDPGENVGALVDDECRDRRGCPDDVMLRALGVYLTRDRRVEIPTLGTLGGVGSQSGRPVHQVTVVLLDDDGRRVGGYSASLDVRFEQ